MRSPIIVTLGHVDHGKTTLLDSIRGTAVVLREPGEITQSISSTFIPADTIENLCGTLLEKFKISVSIPGLLLIDTPGHEAFTTLRSRGGSIADLAILVIDINEGLMPQTKESLSILKQSRVPFVVALNKIDRIQGWLPGSYDEQSERTKSLFDEKFYNVVAQLSEIGFESERYDKVIDFKKTVAIVPISAKNSYGLAELLTLLTGLSQQFLRQQLITGHESKGMILEAKELVGLGTTIDVIVYDGTVSKDDYLVISEPPMITRIRTLLVPAPLKDMRLEKKFTNIEEAKAACVVKISAPDLKDVVAGCEVRTADSMDEAKTLLKELESEKEDIEIKTETAGLILKADTIGGLEAMINIFKDYPIKQATIGQITKEEVIRAEANVDPLLRVVIGFNAKPIEEIGDSAKDKGVEILSSDVIYRLIEDYEKLRVRKVEELRKEELSEITRPCKFRILPGLVFRASDPVIAGCEIIAGILKPGADLFKDDKKIGRVKQIQSQGKDVDEAKIGDKVAVSIVGQIVMGRQLDEGDILYTDISNDEYQKLKKYEDLLTEHEKTVLEEIFEIKRKKDDTFGLY
ncbi:MAG: translation initiation factor IF-2 [Candidatus Aenigmatarchaeota archaeon]